MGVRRQAREAALQAVYMCDRLKLWDEAALTLFFDSFTVPDGAREYAELLVRGVLEKQQVIEAQITLASANWSISRMSVVDRSLLKIAAYELLFCPNVPLSAAINEAIEIAKRYGTAESPTFINGLLDKIASNRKANLHLETQDRSFKKVVGG